MRRSQLYDPVDVSTAFRRRHGGHRCLGVRRHRVHQLGGHPGRLRIVVERELHDLFGIEVTDHPLPRRLVRHQHWPDGWYPMRRDAGPPPAFGDIDEPYPFLTVAGTGVYEIPVGPIHAGLIEPGHFRFSVVGETILKLKARLWFVHKGIEKLAEGKSVADALALAERVSGDTSVGHALAFCLAVEEARDWPVPPQTQVLRALLLELERLYNHVTDIGALCNDVGYGMGRMYSVLVEGVGAPAEVFNDVESATRWLERFTTDVL